MKSNVLQLVGSFQQGGTERQAVQLIGLLRASDRFGVHVACLDRSGALRGEVERGSDGGEIAEFPLTSFYDKNFVRQLNRFARLLRERRIEVVHTHDFYTNVFGMLGATLARVPARVASRREIVGWRTPAQKRVERFAYRFAHEIVANAEAVKDQLAREGVPAAKVNVVYNGMDMRRIKVGSDARRAETLAELGVAAPPEAHVVTIVANMHHPVKDQRTFLRAARRVSEAQPQTAFVLAGEGELKDELQGFAAGLGLGESAFFTGRCAQVAELLAASDVCVLSSVSEGFSNSILEYMAARRPVVATDVGGAREAIVEGETGFLVRAGDDEAMAERITGLLHDAEKRRAMGERGRRIVEEKFSCEAQLRRMESLYERLLARARGEQVVPAAHYADGAESGGALSGR